MNIGFVVYGSFEHRSGGFRYDRQLLRGLRDAGDTVEPIELPWRAYSRGLLDNLSPALRERLEAGYDVLLQDELAHPSLVVTNRRLSTPIISIVHLLRATEPRRLTPLYRAVERWYLGSVDGVVCNSTDTRDLVTDLGVAAETTVVAPPAGDRFDPPDDAIDVTTPTAEEPLRIVFVGNISPRKGLDTLIAAIDAVKSAVELTIVGQSTADDYLSDVRQQIATCGLSDRVTITGELTDDELESTLRAHHLLAVPSRYEAFGIVYAEAMSYGLPVIASRAGGASDIVTDGENGFLVDPSDPTDVAAAITTLAENPDQLQRMGQAARHRYESHVGWPTTTQRVRALLRAAAAERL
jgi:glycosyltransferase involved in cell wall biosynthesis